MAKRSSAVQLSDTELRAELRRRERRLRALSRRRANLLRKADEAAQEIAALGGSIGTGTRFRNSMTLVEALAKVLKDKPMRVLDAVEAVQRAGYRSAAANLRVIVNTALINSGKFKRVGRGMYTAK